MEKVLLTELLVNFLVIFVHIFLLPLLANVKSRYLKRSQKYLLISHYSNELAYSILTVIIILLPRETYTTWTVKHFLVLIRRALILVMYHMIMIYITLDRFFEILLNIKYPLYCSPRIVLYLILGSLLISIFISTVTSVTWFFYRWNTTVIFHLYVYPVLMTVFIVCFFVTYTYIFQILRKNRKLNKSLQRQLNQGIQRTRLQANSNKFKSRQYIPTLIIITFFIFVCVPNAIKILDKMVHKMPRFMRKTNWILLPIGFILDACIYVSSLKFLPNVLKRRFMQKQNLNSRKSTSRPASSSELTEKTKDK